MLLLHLLLLLFNYNSFEERRYRVKGSCRQRVKGTSNGIATHGLEVEKKSKKDKKLWTELIVDGQWFCLVDYGDRYARDLRPSTMQLQTSLE